MRLVPLLLVLLTVAFVTRAGGPSPPPAAEAAPTPRMAARLLWRRPLPLNRATAADLEALPGVGPTRAAAIVQAREAAGGFATVDDLLDVPGIGEATFARIAPLVTLE